MIKTERPGEGTEVAKLVRSQPFQDGKVMDTRSEVLANGQNVDAY